MFATITHLDMTFHNQYFQPTFPPLERFLALTHFSVAHGSTMPPATWCDDVLKACPRLQILLRFSDTLYYEELSGLSPRHRDLRVVVMLQPVGAWTAHWVHDAWPLAENVVRERRAHAAGASILVSNLSVRLPNSLGRLQPSGPRMRLRVRRSDA
jgi:hypothetical protein